VGHPDTAAAPAVGAVLVVLAEPVPAVVLVPAVAVPAVLAVLAEEDTDPLALVCAAGVELDVELEPPQAPRIRADRTAGRATRSRGGSALTRRTLAKPGVGASRGGQRPAGDQRPR
jgi:hypothetical protein